jgi:hypothetical protein
MRATWIIAGLFAGIAGVMLGLSLSRVQVNIGFFLLLPMFAAVILGGIRSVYGVILGAYVVGVAMDVGFTVLPVGNNFRVPIAFVVLFTLGGFALVFGVLLGYNDFAGPRLYLAGIVVVLPFFLGYAAWHTVFDHGAFWPYIEAQESHGEDPILIVLAHLRVERLALVSKLAELGLLGCLVALLRLDERRPDQQ